MFFSSFAISFKDFLHNFDADISELVFDFLVSGAGLSFGGGSGGGSGGGLCAGSGLFPFFWKYFTSTVIKNFFSYS